MKSGGLFAGYGGLDMAVAQMFGAEPAWFSEIDEAPSKILAHHWPDVPNHGDITRIDWDAVEPVDILSGGFPCQDVSAAGKRAGLHPDTRSGLWNHMAYAISKLRPRYVVAENVRGLLSAEAHSDVEPCPWCLGDGPGEPALRALGAVLADLADLGYDAQWYGLRAADIGAPHGRFRVFILAEDTNVATGGERRLAASGQAEGGRAWADAGGRGRASLADTSSPEWRGSESGDLAQGSDPAPEPRERAGDAAWGRFACAIKRWEQVTGRLAPRPTLPGMTGDRLSPAFVEWMMGLPEGHVTAVPDLTRNEQLKALGNGVVPQQAEAALHVLHSAALGVAA